MQFQHDWPKDKNITALLLFLPENLEKYRSTELYDAPLERLFLAALGQVIRCSKAVDLGSLNMQFQHD